MPHWQDLRDPTEQKAFADANSYSAAVYSKCHKQIDHKSIDSVRFSSFARLSTLILTNTPNATSSPHVFVEAITNENFRLLSKRPEK